MKKIAKTVAALTLCAAVLSCFAVCASAVEYRYEKQYKQLLVLGDSITTGYALPSYSTSNPYSCASYANQLAAALGLKAKSTYVNKAVNGDRSQDLLNLLPGIKSNVQASDLIVISIGGNDLLTNVTKIATVLAGKNVGSAEEAAQVILSANAAAYMNLAQNTEVFDTLNSAITKFDANIKQIMARLKEYNPNAKVVFLAQYTPTANVDQAAMFNIIVAPLIETLNEKLYEAAAAAGYTVADIPSVINDNAGAKTNILSYDIHPNTVGHAAIFGKLCDVLGITEFVPCTQHSWGDWKIISEGLIWEPYTAQRTCSACGETDTQVFPARETKPVETTAEVTTAEITTAEITVPAQTLPEETSVDVTVPDDTGANEPAVTTSVPGGKTEITGGAKQGESGPQIRINCESSLSFAVLPLMMIGCAVVFKKKK